MGCIKNIDFKNYPKQSEYLGKTVEVCYHYDSDEIHRGTIIRDDAEEPFRTIIQLENGGVLLTTECQYGLPK